MVISIRVQLKNHSQVLDEGSLLRLSDCTLDQKHELLFLLFPYVPVCPDLGKVAVVGDDAHPEVEDDCDGGDGGDEDGAAELGVDVGHVDDGVGEEADGVEDETEEHCKY